VAREKILFFIVFRPAFGRHLHISFVITRLQTIWSAKIRLMLKLRVDTCFHSASRRGCKFAFTRDFLFQNHRVATGTLSN
jgi:hypothetical protein